MSPCASRSFRTRASSPANSPPAIWSSAARQTISRSTASRGRPPTSQPTIALRWLGLGLFYYREWHLMAADGTTLNISPMGNLRSNSGAVLIVAALAGHGLVYLPTYFVGDALQSGRLVTVLDDYMAPPLPLRALYPHNRYLSAKVRAFVDFLAARFGQEPPWDSWRRVPSEQSALPSPHQTEMIGRSTKPRRSKSRADTP